MNFIKSGLLRSFHSLAMTVKEVVIAIFIFNVISTFIFYIIESVSMAIHLFVIASVSMAIHLFVIASRLVGVAIQN